MTVFDYVVIAIIGLSIVLSVIRGLVREVLALLAWVVAFLAANFCAGPLATLLPDEIPNVEVRLLVGFGAGLTWAAAVVRLGVPAEGVAVANWPTAVSRVKNLTWQARRQVSGAVMAAMLPLWARTLGRGSKKKSS